MDMSNRNTKYKKSGSKNKIMGLLLLAGFSVLQGKASASDSTTKAGTGCLQVFSETQEVQWGEGSFYHPHTGYRI